MEPLYRIALEADIVENCRVDAQQTDGYTRINSSWNCGNSGTMHVQEYAFEGFVLSQMVGDLKGPVEITSNSLPPWIGMMYLQDGCIRSSMAGRAIGVDAQRHNLLFEECETSRHVFVPGKQFRAFHVTIEPTFFEQLVINNSEWTALYEPFLKERTPFTVLPDAIPQSDGVNTFIQQILTCPFGGTLKRMFLEARFLDLFTEQQNQYRQTTQKRLPNREKDLFYAIKGYLDENYQEPPSLLDLAKIFGTNDFKLKKGFKTFFGTTVFGYVAEKRLQTARQLLVATHMPVQEISEQVGYASAAHFATAFRKKFGISPSQVKR